MRSTCEDPCCEVTARGAVPRGDDTPTRTASRLGALRPGRRDHVGRTRSRRPTQERERRGLAEATVPRTRAGRPRSDGSRCCPVPAAVRARRCAAATTRSTHCRRSSELLTDPGDQARRFPGRRRRTQGAVVGPAVRLPQPWTPPRLSDWCTPRQLGRRPAREEITAPGRITAAPSAGRSPGSTRRVRGMSWTSRVICSVGSTPSSSCTSVRKKS